MALDVLEDICRATKYQGSFLTKSHAEAEAVDDPES